jgi:hypothetical protein
MSEERITVQTGPAETASTVAIIAPGGLPEKEQPGRGLTAIVAQVLPLEQVCPLAGSCHCKWLRWNLKEQQTIDSCNLNLQNYNYLVLIGHDVQGISWIFQVCHKSCCL